ncbi:MAG: helix-turn-helix domain-containing protein [Acidimicrobiales bacterium]
MITLDHSHDVTVILGAADDTLQAALAATGFLPLLTTPVSEIYVRERPPAEPGLPPAASLLSVRQAAAELGIGRSKIYELIAAGELEVIHIGRTTRVPPDAIAALIQRLRQPEDRPRNMSQGLGNVHDMSSRRRR